MVDLLVDDLGDLPVDDLVDLPVDDLGDLLVDDLGDDDELDVVVVDTVSVYAAPAFQATVERGVGISNALQL